MSEPAVDIVAEMRLFASPEHRGNIQDDYTIVPHDSLNAWADHMERLQANRDTDLVELCSMQTETIKRLKEQVALLTNQEPAMSKQTFDGVEYDIGPQANLVGVNLFGADLRGADLQGADLTGANLTGVDLSGANLRYANLTGADLRYVYLCGANLCGAYLFGADLTGATLPDGTKWITPVDQLSKFINPTGASNE